MAKNEWDDFTVWVETQLSELKTLLADHGIFYAKPAAETQPVEAPAVTENLTDTPKA